MHALPRTCYLLSSASRRYLSARCSDGSRLGFYTFPDSAEKPRALASSGTGFKSVNGSGQIQLESLGDVLDGHYAWNDVCEPGAVIKGYQIKFVPRASISQIRLLCNGRNASACGMATV